MKKIFDKTVRAIDRIISGSLGKQVLFFLLIASAVFIILFAFRIFIFHRQSEVSSDFLFWDTLFNFIEPAGLENLDGFERLLVIIVNLSGMVIFAGVLIALLTNTIYQRIDNVKNGEIYYSFDNHIVIIGYNNICDELIEQLAEKHEFVLQTSQDVNEARRNLFYHFSDKIKKKVTFVSGSRVLRQDIENLNIHKCKQVFLLGDMNEDAHDSINIECLKIINKIASENGRKNLRCHLLFENHSTHAAFQQHEIPEIRNNIDLVPFNLYDMWAQKIFVKNEYAYNGGKIIYKNLDHKPITGDSQMRVHLIILGMSDMGIALGIQASQLCHFPNYATKEIKTRITFIDKLADDKMNSFKVRYRSFINEIDYTYQCYKENIKFDNKSSKTKFTDIEMEFIKASFEDDEVQSYLEKAALDKTSYVTIAAALSDSTASLNTALFLPSCIFDTDTSILVRQRHSHAIVSMLSRDDHGEVYRKYKNMHPFGMADNCYEHTQADDLLPMMIKYAYDNTSFSEEITIKDFDEAEIRKNWENNWRLTDNLSALKASNRYAANFIFIKQRSLDIKEGVDLDKNQVYLAAYMEHNRWVTEKLLVGFRAPTPEEEADITKEKREYFKAHFIHQDIKSYHDLGFNEKNIDVRLYDINISNALPYMIKAYKKNG